MTTYSVAELFRHMPGDAQPPLHYLLLKGWIVLFGDSPFALRSLSVVFALASIVVLYALCREAAARFPSAAPSSFTSRSGALFAALLLAIHLAPVDEPSRNARMYSQGVFLAGLTAWLLLRALRCPRGCFGWWLGYGLAVAAFCYTHYYAFFTVAAQTLFVSGDLAVRRCKKSAPIRASLTGFLVGRRSRFSALRPLVPGMVETDARCLAGLLDTTRHRWNTPKRCSFAGAPACPLTIRWSFRWWAFFLLACTVWMLCKADRGGLFFLMQAIRPLGIQPGSFGLERTAHLL